MHTATSYLALGQSYLSVAGVYCLSGRLLDPNDVADGGVGDGEDGERNDVLERDDHGRVRQLPGVIGPRLQAQAADGVHAGKHGDRKWNDDGQQPDNADGGENLTGGDARS